MEREETMTVSHDSNTTVTGIHQRTVDTPDDRTRLRRSVLHLGALFGWSQEEIVLFAEAVGTRRWEELEVRDLLVVLHEYRAMLQVLAAKLARRQCRAAVVRHDTGGYDDCGD